MKKNDLSTLTDYLAETLGISVIPKPMASASRLPFFLQNFYSLFEVKLLNSICILAVDGTEQEQSPAIIRKHIDQIRAKYDKEIVYVRSQITAYNRKRLIEHKVPFIVPENQMYLPMLAIDMREHFKTSRLKPLKLSPSAQVVVIYLLVRDGNEIITPAQIAKRLGYSAMTMTRAFDELEELDIGEFSKKGRERHLRFMGDKKNIWEKALPLLQSPVKRRFYIKTTYKGLIEPLSGLSALAHYSMLVEPKNSIFALSGKAWKVFSHHHDVDLIPFLEPDACEIEIWSYAPLLFSKDGIVDRLSLYVSLKDNQDERIESGLDHMMKEMKW
jgi:DNA-binding MarR family transcriptional regulator